MDRASFLKNVKPFVALSDDELAHLGSRTTVERFEPGTRIIARGEAGDAMYMIASGQVRIPILDRENRQRFIAQLERFQVFGEMALLTDSPRNADVFAAGDEPCVCLRLDRAATDELLRENPVVARFLTDMLNERLLESEQFRDVGKYRLDFQLGRGGMAVVYAGYHKDLRRQVAIKMLSHQLTYQPSFARRFQQEARLVAELRHPNIVSVYDTERAYGTYFIVMELLRGSDLGQQVRSAGPLGYKRAREIFRQVLDALGYAHKKGIVHRDIKPSNIGIDDDDRVKLLDFGLAGAVDSTRIADTPQVADAAMGPGTCVGTVEYIAPEILDGAQADVRTDIYALGITAYSALTGTLPFRGDTPKEILLHHRDTPMPDVRLERPDVPDDLRNFVMRATAKRPAARFASCEEAAESLSGAEPPALPDPTVGRLVAVTCRPGDAERVDAILTDFTRSLRELEGARVSVNPFQPPR